MQVQPHITCFGHQGLLVQCSDDLSVLPLNQRVIFLTIGVKFRQDSKSLIVASLLDKPL
jgi:hypothetical protein